MTSIARTKNLRLKKTTICQQMPQMMNMKRILRRMMKMCKNLRKLLSNFRKNWNNLRIRKISLTSWKNSKRVLLPRWRIQLMEMMILKWLFQKSQRITWNILWILKILSRIDLMTLIDILRKWPVCLIKILAKTSTIKNQ